MRARTEMRLKAKKCSKGRPDGTPPYGVENTPTDALNAERPIEMRMDENGSGIGIGANPFRKGMD